MDLGPLQRLLQARPGLVLALVFGSVARGEAGPDSDVDVAVQFDRPIDAAERLALIEAIAELTGRAVDLVDLRAAGAALVAEVLRDGIRLVGGAEAQAALLSRHLLDMADFQPLVDRMLAERRAGWIG